MTQKPTHCAEGLRAAAARLLTLAQQIDGINPYIIAHHHERGDSFYLAHFSNRPNLAIGEDITAADLAGVDAILPDAFRGVAQVFLDVGDPSNKGGYATHLARLQVDGDLVARLEQAYALCHALNLAEIELQAAQAEILVEDLTHPARILVQPSGFRVRSFTGGMDSGPIAVGSLRIAISAATDGNGHITPVVLGPLSAQSWQALETALPEETADDAAQDHIRCQDQ